LVFFTHLNTGDLKMAARKKAVPSAKKSAPRRRGAEHTKARFLLATEQIFCRVGYEGTTIRAVASRARVNLGTLQHYWGSKHALFKDLFVRRFTPLAASQLRRLQALESSLGKGERPQVRDVLKIFVDLTFDIGYADETPSTDPDSPISTHSTRTLYGRALMDPSKVVIDDMNRIFEKSVLLFLSLMQRACPNLSIAELDWRITCITGAHMLSLVHMERMGRFFGEATHVPDETASEWVLNFFLNGINAPAGIAGVS
jgi:AcrR family transcriptional regulator